MLPKKCSLHNLLVKTAISIVNNCADLTNTFVSLFCVTKIISSKLL